MHSPNIKIVQEYWSLHVDSDYNSGQRSGSETLPVPILSCVPVELHVADDMKLGENVL
jgi:hypothetical protein